MCDFSTEKMERHVIYWSCRRVEHSEGDDFCDTTRGKVLALVIVVIESQLAETRSNLFLTLRRDNRGWVHVPCLLLSHP